MNKIKTFKIKNEDGSVSEETYTIAVDARNVDMENGKELQETIGTIDIDTDGNIAEQLENLNDNINNLNIDIKKKAYFFDTVAEMKNAKLKAGDYAVTLGYYEANDGGGGDYLIRVKNDNDVEDNGSIHFLEKDKVAELIINDNINVKQFGAYGDSIHDDTIAIQNAFNLAKANKDKKAFVKFTAGTYNVSDTINIHTWTHIIPFGIVRINDTSNKNYTFSVSPDVSDINGRTWHFIAPFIDNSQGILFLYNQSGNDNKVGIHITGKIGDTSEKRRTNNSIRGLQTMNYYVGIQIDAYSTYIMDITDSVFTGNEIDIMYGNENMSFNDSGEKFSINKCTFSNSSCAIYICNPFLELTIYNSSFDMLGSCTYAKSGYRKLTFNDCHFEEVGTGMNNTHSFKSFDGIVRAPDTSSYERYITILNNCKLNIGQDTPYPENYMFKGNGMILYVNDLMYDFSASYYFKHSVDKPFISAFLCDDDVNVVKYSASATERSKPSVQSSKSVINPYFNNDTPLDFTIDEAKRVTSTDVLKDYTVTSSINVESAKIALDTDINKNCLCITPYSIKAESRITLLSKKYFLLKGDRFDGRIFIKNYKSGQNSTCGIKLYFYDSEKNQISSTNTFCASFRTNTSYVLEHNTGWIGSTESRGDVTIQIPKGTVYYKIEATIRGNNGGEDYSEVKCTGIHVFNY